VPTPAENRAAVNGINIWYERTNPGAGVPIILHHGFGGPSSAGLHPVMEELRRRFDVVIFDARAHGRTGDPADLSTVTLPQFAADEAGLMDALGIERAHILGVSMGGMVSAQFACDFPERVASLWLCDTTAGNREGPDEAANAAEQQMFEGASRIKHIAEKYGMEELVRRENRYRREVDPHAHESAQSLDEQDAGNYRNKVEFMMQAGWVASAAAMMARPDLTSRTPQITVPALVSCGEWDLFYPCAVRDGRLIPNAKFVTIRGAGHDTVNYTPEEWLRTGLAFYRSLGTIA
jgi:pimeloyl-ACP methyl ester carboxylesterase